MMKRSFLLLRNANLFAVILILLFSIVDSYMHRPLRLHPKRYETVYNPSYVGEKNTRTSFYAEKQDADKELDLDSFHSSQWSLLKTHHLGKWVGVQTG